YARWQPEGTPPRILQFDDYHGPWWSMAWRGYPLSRLGHLAWTNLGTLSSLSYRPILGQGAWRPRQIACVPNHVSSCLRWLADVSSRFGIDRATHGHDRCAGNKRLIHGILALRTRGSGSCDHSNPHRLARISPRRRVRRSNEKLWLVWNHHCTLRLLLPH